MKAQSVGFQDIENLLGLLTDLVISEKTIVLYLYYRLHGSEAPTLDQVKQGTGLNTATIRKHTSLLEALKMVTVDSKRGGRGKGRGVVALPVEKHTTPLPSYILDILNIPSQKTNSQLYIQHLYGTDDNNSNNIYKKKRGYGMLFSKKDIEEDADWQKAREPLAKHFKDFEIDVSALLRRNRFTSLLDLLEDSTFDFAGYCHWYHEHKYSERGFNFGLFLYSGMVAEYRAYTESSGKYLKTASRLAGNESFQRGLEQTKAFLDGLEDE
jgi:hypothetical protein